VNRRVAPCHYCLTTKQDWRRTSYADMLQTQFEVFKRTFQLPANIHNYSDLYKYSPEVFERVLNDYRTLHELIPSDKKRRNNEHLSRLEALDESRCLSMNDLFVMNGNKGNVAHQAPL
jgi:hypothetical protein